MNARMLSGEIVAKKLLTSLRPAIKKLNPKLVIVQVGSDAASTSYIKKKMQSCRAVGMRSEHIHLAKSIKSDELSALIAKLNADDDVSGFIIQLPLPQPLQKFQPELFRSIDPHKDVDGFTAYNLGKVFLSTEFEHLPPATPAGIIALLEYYKIKIEGKHIVVVGHSNLVGKPLAVMLINRLATVTVCNHKTKSLALHTKQADILISAVGKPGLISVDMVKGGAVVIDVGLTKTKQGLRGDVDSGVKKIASAMTPVTGGVGPMTVASLIRNCVRAKERQMNDRLTS